MDVFISWSGERSKAVAILMKEWLKCVVQASRPWVSSQNITPGTIWFNQISERLNSSSIGIICLTKENKNNPWILFEAGALAKGLAETRVCTFLIDLDTTDIQPPLSEFNATRPDKEELWALVQLVNIAVGDRALEEGILRKVFETYWPQFESAFDKAIADSVPEEPVPDRTQDSILSEILQTTRSLSNRMSGLERSRQWTATTHPEARNRVTVLTKSPEQVYVRTDDPALQIFAQEDLDIDQLVPVYNANPDGSTSQREMPLSELVSELSSRKLKVSSKPNR